jgi:hypothetical protein
LHLWILHHVSGPVNSTGHHVSRPVNSTGYEHSYSRSTGQFLLPGKSAPFRHELALIM